MLIESYWIPVTVTIMWIVLVCSHEEDFSAGEEAFAAALVLVIATWLVYFTIMYFVKTYAA